MGYFALLGHGLLCIGGSERKVVGAQLGEIRRDLHTLGANHLGGFCWAVLVGRHDAVVHVALIGLLAGEERGWNFSQATVEPSEDSVIHRCRDTKEVIESLVEGHVADRLCPVAVFVGLPGEIHTEMPLADHGGGVASGLEHRSNRHPAIGDEAGALGMIDTSLQRGTPGIATSEEPVARGSANSVRGMAVGEADPLGRKTVEMRRGDLRLGVKAGSVSVALIISVDDEDVRQFLRRDKRAEAG